jgi:hypothetical protein
MPGTGESLPQTLARGVPLEGSPGEAYVQSRAISLAVAHEAGVRFAADFAGRAAVIQPLYNYEGSLVSLHARYLAFERGLDKMFTIGPGQGAIHVLGGWRADPLIIVEGLFDALSLAVCGWGSVATVGRWVPWLREAAAGRTAWLAFDAGRAGEGEAVRYAEHLSEPRIRRLLTPGRDPVRDKDWNTALVKRGPAAVTRWIEGQLSHA